MTDHYWKAQVTTLLMKFKHIIIFFFYNSYLSTPEESKQKF